MHLAAQCVCRQQRQLRYMADLYSNRTELIPTMETVTVPGSVRPVTLWQTVAGRAEAAPGSGEVIRVCATARGTMYEEGAVHTTVSVRLLCRTPEGRFFTARTRLNAEFTLPETSGVTGVRSAMVTVTEAAAPSLAEDIRITLRMDALAIQEESFSCVQAVEVSGEEPADRPRTPSFILARVPAGTDMWTLARRCHSTMEAIASVNEGRQEGLLLIPRAR